MDMGMTPLAELAMGLRALMDTRGWTRADFAHLTSKNRYHASLNPLAEVRQPISAEDVLESPFSLIGPVPYLVDKLTRLRQRWGINSFLAGWFGEPGLRDFAPVGGITRGSVARGLRGSRQVFAAYKSSGPATRSPSIW